MLLYFEITESMNIFKFGGASVKDADAVKNIVTVLKTVSCSNTFMVLSAMGKTTNALEEVIALYFNQSDYSRKILEIKEKHLEIANELFDSGHPIFETIDDCFNELNIFLERNKSPNYDFVYDQTVCFGELLSTKIVNAYLNDNGFESVWIDVRNYIKTDNTYREGKVDWIKTEENLKKLESDKFYLTQGFLGSDSNNFTTTLGREGSDYTAAIIANCLDAESLTIWKDVPGVLNADPRYFEKTELLKKISYEEAIELAYYGASVIHPKTMKPLRSKGIPFFVKSFLNPEAEGTHIGNKLALEPNVACYILKTNQNLLTLTSLDFSFITEEKISRIFKSLHERKLKVNLMQNSAVTLSLCLEDKFNQLSSFIEEIKKDFEIECEKGVSLYTVRNFDDKTNIELGNGRELLRQIIKNTLQLIKSQ